MNTKNRYRKSIHRTATLPRIGWVWFADLEDRWWSAAWSAKIENGAAVARWPGVGGPAAARMARVATSSIADAATRHAPAPS